MCRVHAIFRLRLIFTYAAFWTCASSTLSYLLPCLGFLFWTQDHFCAGLGPINFLGNSVWFSFQIRCRSRAVCPDIVVRRRDVHEVPYVCLCVFFLRGVVPAWDVDATSDFIRGGGVVLVSPWQLQGITFLCITLYDFVLSCVLLNHSFHYTLL
jgi:hypothetical protein